MGLSLGIDVGGTKTAGALYDENGKELDCLTYLSPPDYDSFLKMCRTLVDRLEAKHGPAQSVGVGTCGFLQPSTGKIIGSPNLVCLVGQSLVEDLERTLERKVCCANDAACAALAEAVDGAGKGFSSVLGLILGTGVGSGLVVNGHLVPGANGMCGEVGHLPLPAYEESDGPLLACGCGRTGCIETFVSGSGLARLYHTHTGRTADAKSIGQAAQGGDPEAQQVLERYYVLVAKAMATVLQTFDPAVIVVSGGLSALPGLYEAVPKLWGRYTLCSEPLTRFVPATLGPLAGMRGAALLGAGSVSSN